MNDSGHSIEHATLDTRGHVLFQNELTRIQRRTDRMFAWLLLVEWLAAIVVALSVTPRTWMGEHSAVHIHVWTALFLVGAVISLPVALAFCLPGRTLTRHLIGVAQMLVGAVLIHLSGGRIETHFHVFGSLAFLAFYRDWRVLVTASAVVAADHFLRGIFLPQSVYGIQVVDEWRWLEHAAWVLFEDAFLIRACQQSIQEMHAIAERQACLENTNCELALLHQQAMEANRVKSSFLANMSHELRTPLNAVIGYSELLQTLAQRKGQTETLSDLNRITQAGRHLLSLINDVLDISKIEAGKMQFFLEDLDAGHLVQDVVATVKPMIEKNGNTLILQNDGTLGTIRADLTRLRQCLFNLLSNAGKFTKKGTITLDVGRQHAAGGERIVFRVRDTGIGMAPEQVNRLFQPFTQADASTTRKYGGTGLGLAITRNLCRMMGGDIEVQSELGQGTTFICWLPTIASLPAPAAISTVSAMPASAKVAPSHDRPTILVIDDDPTVGDLLTRILGRDGFAVVVAARGTDGLRLGRELRPRAIVLDVMMPGMDGWATLTAFKSDPELSAVPVVLLSVIDDKGMGYSLGASDYLTKPIDPERLSATVKRFKHAPSPSRAISAPALQLTN